MGRVEGKVVLVTGAASPIGLGNACVTALLREGARVVMTDVDAARIHVTAAEHGQPDRVLSLVQDVGDEASWDRTMARILERFGRLDGLVNNAGIGMNKDIAEVTLAEWDLVIRINLTGSFLGTRAAICQMRAQGGGGSIVNISSIAGIVSMPGTVPYTASKGGVRMMSRAIALEGAKDGIRCNSVHPGIMWTEIQKVAIESGIFDDLAASVPVGRLGAADDIANAVIYLSSDESSYVTGTEIVVDGGYCAR